MDLIDLHVHSNASDGSLTPSEVADEAIRMGLKAKAEKTLAKKLDSAYEELFTYVEKLVEDTDKAEAMDDLLKRAYQYHDKILEEMAQIREVADSVEVYFPADLQPYPTYADMLFYV